MQRGHRRIAARLTVEKRRILGRRSGASVGKSPHYFRKICYGARSAPCAWPVQVVPVVRLVYPAAYARLLPACTLNLYPRRHKCRYVDRFKSRRCIVAKHPKHTSSHNSRGGLELKAGYEIKFLPSFGACKTAALCGQKRGAIQVAHQIRKP